jgi:hypothetical protein
MRYWRDPQRDIEYRLELRSGIVVIDRKKVTDALWKRCCYIPRELLEVAGSVYKH